jgi:hypothetical protein
MERIAASANYRLGLTWLRTDGEALKRTYSIFKLPHGVFGTEHIFSTS